MNRILVLFLVYALCANATPRGDLQRDQRLSQFKTCVVSNGAVEESVIHYGDAEYAKANYQWNVIHPTKNPLGYFQVKTVQDVQSAVLCAKSLGIRLVVKGGGHSYEEFSFGDDNTFIVDVQYLTEFSVAANRESFTIGAGGLLGHIAYPLLEYHNLVTPHGTCPTVGIVGLATGGGYGYLSRLYGLTTDSIIAVEMVDASGRLLAVNAQTNPDLLWAMRGAGSGSFGIVTRLTMKAYTPPEIIVGGTKIYDLDQFPIVFMSWQNFVEEFYEVRDVNTKMSIKNGLVTVEIFDIQIKKPNSPGNNVLDRIVELLNKFPGTATVNTTSVVDSIYPDFLFHTSHPDDIGITDPSELQNVTRQMFSQRNFHAKSYFASRSMTWEEIWEMYFVIEETVRGVDNIIIEMYQFGAAINDMSSTTDTSFNHRHGVLYLVQAFLNSKPNSNDQPSRNWLRKFLETTERVVGHTSSYQNYADAELQNHLQRYYGSNLNRLMQIKRNVDPDNFFRHPQSIPLNL